MLIWYSFYLGHKSTCTTVCATPISVLGFINDYYKVNIACVACNDKRTTALKEKHGRMSCTADNRAYQLMKLEEKFQPTILLESLL